MVEFGDFDIRREGHMVFPSAMPAGLDFWESLMAARGKFFESGEAPEDAPFLRKEILDSWKRCRSAGVDPWAEDLADPVSDSDYAQIVATYSDVIDALTPLLGMIDGLGLESDYIFEFVARNGVAVLKSGDLNLHEIVYSQSVMNEFTMGTNAHTLCMRHKMPVQVVGPEHYCEALRHIAGVACPVFDKHGVVIGSLLLTQPIPDEPWSFSYQKLLSHAAAFVTSVAAALEAQLVFHESLAVLADTSDKLEEASKSKHVLDIAIGSSASPVIVVNAAGLIQHASPEAVHLLNQTIPNLIGSSVEEALGLPWPDAFQPLMMGDRGLEVSTQIGSKSYGVRGNLVKNAKSGELEGLVMRLSEVAEPRSGDRKVGDSASIAFEDILGKSSAMSIARTIARRYAKTTENVLIIGESGTGKEYFAQAIHNASRRKGPFMSINCAAIPPRLIESELFGYEGGSFTGAERGGKPGKIELSDGGTLFLDEIGDMPLELQATLLRVLENKRVMRIGGKGYKQVDFRVVAATNRNLPQMVAEGKFREDLLYRLSILTINLPPLREREGDVLFFAHYFLNECRRKTHEGPTGISKEAEALIEAFPWPGNVRQIKNVIFSAFYASTGGEIRDYDLPQYVRACKAVQFGEFGSGRDDAEASSRDDQPREEKAALESKAAAPCEDGRAQVDLASTSLEGSPSGVESESVRVPASLLSLREMEESAVKLAMVHTGGNVSKAAEILGISKATLYRKLKEFGIG